jgi:hypothetical protein
VLLKELPQGVGLFNKNRGGCQRKAEMSGMPVILVFLSIAEIVWRFRHHEKVVEVSNPESRVSMKGADRQIAVLEEGKTLGTLFPSVNYSPSPCRDFFSAL